VYFKKVFLLSADTLAVLITLPLSLFVRLDFSSFLSTLQNLSAKHFIVIAGSYFSAFFALKTYRTIVRLANLFTAVRVAVACFVGAIASYVLVVHLFALQPLPRSTYVIQFLLLTPMLVGLRFSWRLGSRLTNRAGSGVPTLVYGAGSATDRFLPVMIRMTEEMRIIGIIDDDLAKRGSEVQGVRVRGTRKDIPRLMRKYGVEQILLSMPSVSGPALRKIVDELYALNLRVKVLPAAEAYVKSSDTLQVNDIRDLNIEDLLRRAPRSINKAAIQAIIKGRVVLVTGGGGSIGSELVRQIAAMEPSKLVVNDSSEYSLYKISEEIREKHPSLKYVSHLGDVANAAVAENLFKGQKIQAVFHACAYKHVPLVEENICSAVLNNILSARNIFELATKHSCEQVVLISSDKAVRPTNVMGATKRICELLALWYAGMQSKERQCAFSAVRFGNVLGSSGSVVPKFIEQIKTGGPVTVTHPEITRYFMLIPEAVSLVLQAATASRSGEIFVLNMGQSIKIVDMVRDLCRLMGKQEGRDIEIKFTGLRRGEKLYEELQLESETLEAVTEDFFKLAVAAEPDSNFLKELSSLVAIATAGEDAEVKDSIFSMVRKYESPEPDSYLDKAGMSYHEHEHAQMVNSTSYLRSGGVSK
jgi:FlaA1/EpsC-like NDP-sugar epimerase